MFGETCHDMAYERHMIEEKEAAARAEAQTNTMTIAQFAERTQSNLNEMGLMLNDIMGNLVGLRKDEVKDVQPVSSFRDWQSDAVGQRRWEAEGLGGIA